MCDIVKDIFTQRTMTFSDFLIVFQLSEVVKLNNFGDVIKVLHQRVEDVQLEEKVDVVVSEWMGFYLLHESMLESVMVRKIGYS